MNYSVDIINHTRKGQELIERIEMERSRLTSREYKNVILGMSYWAAESFRYSALTARVRADGNDLFTIKCDTKQTCSRIRSIFSIARPSERFVRVRSMTIAE